MNITPMTRIKSATDNVEKFVLALTDGASCGQFLKEYYQK